ncbi:hypothetical protein Kp7_15 [Klebsiella phage Kp7]|uniref:Uncharacterized protein n=1 Tax=Klebsiella phage Kp7 TaxID=2936515 RepID=A0AAE9KXZ7_9CAUD|nr:hypothetical protein Kp7_15 [Klebsiella phage Kp7]
MKLVSVEVIFKRSVFDVIRNMFVPKAKRFPRVATFKGVSSFVIEEDGSICVSWGNTYYHYPAHMLARVKTVYED